MIRAAERLEQVWDADTDGVLVRALWSSSLIAYGRCFRSGRRLRLPDEALGVLDAQEREFHDALLAERDKHIAHQVSDLERIEMSVFGKNEGGTRNIDGIAVLMAKQIGPPREQVGRLRALAAKLQTEVLLRRDAAQAQVLAEARAELEEDATPS